MLLTKFDPFKQIKEIEKNLYNQSKNEGVSAFVPVVNTREGEFAYHVDVDLPGVKKEDIKAFEESIHKAAKASIAFLDKPIEKVMNEFNTNDQ